MNFEGEYEIIPELTRTGILRYVEQGIQPGGFLTAVLSNDLYNATGKADRQNLAALRQRPAEAHDRPGRCDYGKSVPEQLK
jgi:hypothetical protein